MDTGQAACGPPVPASSDPVFGMSVARIGHHIPHTEVPMNTRPQPTTQPRPRPAAQAGAEDAFEVPPIADEAAPEGPDVTVQPGAEAGHYGMGYGDPTRHQGGNWPGEGAQLPPKPGEEGLPPSSDQMNQGEPTGATAAQRDKEGGQQ